MPNTAYVIVIRVLVYVRLDVPEYAEGAGGGVEGGVVLLEAVHELLVHLEEEGHTALIHAACTTGAFMNMYVERMYAYVND